MMISKNLIKLIRALEQKKYRKQENAFVAEGPKLVGDILPFFKCRFLAAPEEWLSRNKHQIHNLEQNGISVYPITVDELKRISLQKNPQEVIGIFECKNNIIPKTLNDQKLYLALDDVQDPGNLGTIVRLADWFGIEDIFCTYSSADIYNPKTIQATMGALARVNVHYVGLADFLKRQMNIPIYGTSLDGDDIYQQELSKGGIIVMGNEGKGISEEIRTTLTNKLYIPNYPSQRITSESLNVAIATAIVCAEFRRRV